MATHDYSIESASEEMFEYEYKCTALCLKRNKIKGAVRACESCKKYFCSACLEVHNSLHDDHNTAEPSVMISSQSTYLPTEHCKKHAGKMVDVWCVKHDVVCCVICAFFDHKSCGDDVKDIQAGINDIFKQEDFDSIKTELNANLDYVKGRKDFLKREEKNLLVEKNAQISKIEKHAEKLISMIKALETKAKDELFAAFKEVENEMKKVAEDCNQYEEDFTQCLAELEESTSNEPQMFITMKNVKQSIALTNNKCRGPDVRDCTFVFSPDPCIEPYLAGIKSLGTSLKVIHKYEVKQKQEVNVKMSDDPNNCSILDSCFLPDGSIVLTDFNNHKLKHVDISSASVIGSCLVPSNPCGICCVGQHEFAVALFHKKIQIVSVGRGLTLSRTIPVDHTCFGIAYHKGELFVSEYNKSTIYVYTLQGTLLRKISNIAPSECKHIAISRDGEKLFAACSNSGMIFTNRQGNPKCRYTDKDIKRCYGVCHDERSSLFVCGYMSDNVVQLSENGETVGEILTTSDGVVGPQSLCFDPSRQRLIVTQWSNSLLVVELRISQ